MNVCIITRTIFSKCDLSAGGSSDRGRDGGAGSSGSLAKKSKPGFSGSGSSVRSGIPKQSTGDMVNLLSEEWENVAAEVTFYSYLFVVIYL